MRFVILGAGELGSIVAAHLARVGRPVALSPQNGVLKNEQHFDADQVLGAAASIAGEVLADGSARFTMNERLPIAPADRRVLRLGWRAGGRRHRRGGRGQHSHRRVDRVRGLPAADGRRRAHPPGDLAPPGRPWRLGGDRTADGRGGRAARASGVEGEDKDGLAVASIAAAPPEEAAAIVRRFGASMQTRAPQHRVLPLQDLLRGDHLEVDEILGHAARLGRRLGAPVPAIETCHQLASALSGIPRE